MKFPMAKQNLQRGMNYRFNCSKDNPLNKFFYKDKNTINHIMFF